jgi:hypothetical protein
MRDENGAAVYFYELHEGDDDVFSDALVAHDIEYDEDEFLELVQEARREIVDTFEEDTLVEAIANELQRRHGFLHIDDSRLRVAVNVSANEAGTYVTQVDERRADRDGAGDGDEDYRSLLVEIDPEDPR